MNNKVLHLLLFLIQKHLSLLSDFVSNANVLDHVLFCIRVSAYFYFCSSVIEVQFRLILDANFDIKLSVSYVAMTIEDNVFVCKCCYKCAIIVTRSNDVCV